MSSSYHLSIVEGSVFIDVVMIELRTWPNRRTHTRHEIFNLQVAADSATVEELLEHLGGALECWAYDAERRAGEVRRAAPRGVLDTISDPRLW